MSNLKVVSTSTKYNEESLLSKSEKNDCVVRAVASAFNVKYDEAHAFVKRKFGRENRRGVFYTTYKLQNIESAFNHSIKTLGEKWTKQLGINKYIGKRIFNGLSKRRNCVRRYTTNSFIKAFPKGTYIILVSEHAFTIKGSVVYGNHSDGEKLKARIKNVFEIKSL